MHDQLDLSTPKATIFEKRALIIDYIKALERFQQNIPIRE